MLPFDLACALDPAILMQTTGQTPDPWQATVLRSKASKKLLLCSRQAGKSTVTASIALHKALYYPPALILLLSPSLRQSKELFRKVISVMHSMNIGLKPQEESTLRLELPNSSRIVSLPGKDETIRGFSGVSLIVIDEAAWVPDSLYYSVRPMLAVSKGELLALSSPWGKRGWFYKEWMEGGKEWEKFKVTALDCPRITNEFLENEKASMPEMRFISEYMCEFVDTSDSVFSHDQVMRAITPEVKPLFSDLISI